MVTNVDPALLAAFNRGVERARAAYDREHGLTAYGRKLRKAEANRKVQARRRATASST